MRGFFLAYSKAYVLHCVNIFLRLWFMSWFFLFYKHIFWNSLKWWRQFFSHIDWSRLVIPKKRHTVHALQLWSNRILDQYCVKQLMSKYWQILSDIRRFYSFLLLRSSQLQINNRVLQLLIFYFINWTYLLLPINNKAYERFLFYGLY